jgi:hypothetical protein
MGLVLLNERIDATSPSGQLALHEFGALAEFKRDVDGQVLSFRNHEVRMAARAGRRRSARGCPKIPGGVQRADHQAFLYISRPGAGLMATDHHNHAAERIAFTPRK